MKINKKEESILPRRVISKKQYLNIIKKMKCEMSAESDKVVFVFNNDFFFLDGHYIIEDDNLISHFSVNGVESFLTESQNELIMSAVNEVLEDYNKNIISSLDERSYSNWV